ncbi:hypothetical protein BDA96_08G126500 [Sorghum bicolor]|uniref:Uncharacterized protein n=1 Tax=Sorghum bicolor TaxID=4558 RepID=A0A921QII4_SORBI|nr:hypothetical protein BDA96_08G126500 [Sorghum bicolor]
MSGRWERGGATGAPGSRAWVMLVGREMVGTRECGGDLLPFLLSPARTIAGGKEGTQAACPARTHKLDPYPVVQGPRNSPWFHTLLHAGWLRHMVYWLNLGNLNFDEGRWDWKFYVIQAGIQSSI